MYVIKKRGIQTYNQYDAFELEDMFPLVEKDQEVFIVLAMLLWLTYYKLIKLVINFFSGTTL